MKTRSQVQREFKEAAQAQRWTDAAAQVQGRDDEAARANSQVDEAIPEAASAGSGGPFVTMAVCAVILTMVLAG